MALVQDRSDKTHEVMPTLVTLTMADCPIQQKTALTQTRAPFDIDE